MKYVGVRYASGCHPDDLLVTYFTSSKLVQKILSQFGIDDFKLKILYTYPDDPESAIKKEAEYFDLIKGRKDYLNMCYSSGILDIEIASKAGKIGGSIVYDKKIGIFKDYELRRQWASFAGKASWNSKNNEKFLFWASDAGRKLRSSRGGLNGAFTTAWAKREYGVDFKEATKIIKNEQSSRGKKGGPKNKGFKWYHDGINQFKYTQSNQKELSFEEFLKQNTQYISGRLPSKRELFCPHCGKTGTSPGGMAKHIKNCKYR